MVSNNGRAFPRNCYAAHIRYAVYNTENFMDATMCNSSEGGMYFESETDIQPGTEICIRMTDYSPDVHGPEARDGYRGEVMWCRKLFDKEENKSCYGIGVRFIVNVCDQCGEKVLYSEIHRTADFLFLCPACLKRLSMSGKTIREDVENYLMGNVL